MLDLNITMLIQMVNFFIVLYVLNILLIRPIRRILQERKNTVDNLSGEADAFEREAEVRLASYHDALQRARQQAGQNRDQARNEGLAEQHRMVQDAGKKGQTIVADAHTAIRAEADATLADLRKQVKSLAGKLATRVIG